jgi:hypothetical protein
MKRRLFDIAIGCLLTVMLVILLGADNGNGNLQRYQISGNGVNPVLFVIDQKTGQLWRYVYYTDPKDADERELIRLEKLGTPSEPEYKLVAMMKGSSYEIAPYDFK